MTTSLLHEHLLDTLRSEGLTELPEPVLLASGSVSRWFVDAKRALASGADLRLAADLVVERVAGAGVVFDAVGGMTLGADALSAAVAVVSGADWFVVRKEPKGRGTDRLVEGARLGAGCRVLLVDDVVSTGESILRACEVVGATGAEVVGAVTLVDRDDIAAQRFEELGIAYFPMATYIDMGIPAVSAETAASRDGNAQVAR